MEKGSSSRRKKKLYVQRRASRRLQETTKCYREEEEEDEEETGGGGSEDESDGGVQTRSNCGSDKQKDRRVERGGGGDDGGGGSVSSHFKWSLQSELVTKQLARLFCGGGDGGEADWVGGGGSGGLLTADVTLVSCEGDTVAAHKVVLVLCCPYFRRLFSKLSRSLSRDNSSNTVVVLGNVKTSTLKYLLRFIYTGEVDVPSRGAEQEEFLKIGEFFGISGIRTSCPAQPGGGGGGGDKEESVIKVHVIHKRKSEEGPPPGGEKVSKKPSTSSTPHLKQEPPEEMEDSGPCHFLEDSYDDSFDCSGYGGDSGGDGKRRKKKKGEEDDDAGSNFSDEIRGGGDNGLGEDGGDESSADEYGVKRKKSGGNLEGKPYPFSGRGPHRGIWYEIDPVSEQDMAEHWRISHHSHGVDDYESWTFYCYHGGERCGAKLKRVKEDGDDTFYTNRIPHSNHRETSHGLPHETKLFVVSMLEQGIRKPEKIFKAMRLLSMDLPTKNQIMNFITYKIRTSGPYPFPQRKEPPRVRKRPPPVYSGPPKKRGRPRNTEKLPRLNVHGLPKMGKGSGWKPGEETTSSSAQGGGDGDKEVKAGTSRGGGDGGDRKTFQEEDHQQSHYASPPPPPIPLEGGGPQIVAVHHAFGGIGDGGTAHPPHPPNYPYMNY